MQNNSFISTGQLLLLQRNHNSDFFQPIQADENSSTKFYGTTLQLGPGN